MAAPVAAKLARGIGSTLLFAVSLALTLLACALVGFAVYWGIHDNASRSDIRDALLIGGVGLTALVAAGVFGFWGSWLARNRSTT